jgi:hypothetical protein
LAHPITQIQSGLIYNTGIQRYFKIETHELVKALKLHGLVLYLIQVVSQVSDIADTAKTQRGNPPESDWKQPLLSPLV